MHFVTFQQGGAARLGVCIDDSVVDLSKAAPDLPRDLVALIRDYKKKTAQWTIGKNFDKTGGFGPWMVTPDELPPGGAGLSIRSRLNAQVMQDANTRDMLFPVAETIVLLTECLTLEPGDVVVMGTPAGVGQARTPPVWMKHGDTIEIEGVGLLSNPIRDEVSAV